LLSDNMFQIYLLVDLSYTYYKLTYYINISENQKRPVRWSNPTGLTIKIEELIFTTINISSIL
jgi:hypothetical protein